MHLRTDHPHDERGSYARLRPLLAAEAAAAAAELPGRVEAADLEQAVWLRLLERPAPPVEPGGWIRRAVRAEARAAAGTTRHQHPYADFGLDDAGGPAARGARGVEDLVIAADQRRRVRAAVRRLPGRCPEVVTALMSRSDPTYREISRELGISQGSLGPLRSRCLGCLRTILDSRVGSPSGRGNAR
ncbi:sigma-70 family RNA polymerase sigma factor [Actinacidiphila acidipaludis]|uniref:Sigma-70 family RNA polymerase sigma factor n=1 Tax=Actinacidiphila acidipaludis TaxID=2873382 RepID=A0ABS7QI64_9ACTN|nr:sigma-70 family RNA polymerase sigma factor [Streptomyces acidipaludis]MBY8882853.1 sigma-70 family RNA polymerase sigma factor [Streptomyces acidipaludis]